MNRDHIDPAIGRLLGPAAAETTCDECFDQLDVYVERQVLAGDAAQAMPRLAAHLRGCPACAEDYESLHAFLLSASAPRT
jgi:2-polyprenyl-6-methoxyphenol hydroxylase-like FAD-dependent oxidoreductase